MKRQEINAELLRHRQSLLAYIYALTRNGDAAEEVFQETALAILEEAASGAEVENFPAWAREIARRRSAGFFRRRGGKVRTVPLGESMVEAISRAFNESAEPATSTAQRLRYLQECVDGLSPRFREAINRRYRHGRTAAEIATKMARTVASVHVMLSKAKRLLTECVGRKLRRVEAV